MLHLHKPSRLFAKPALRSVPFLIHTLYIFSLTVNCLRVDAHFLQVYLYVMYELIFKYILWTNLTLDQKGVSPPPGFSSMYRHTRCTTFPRSQFKLQPFKAVLDSDFASECERYGGTRSLQSRLWRCAGHRLRRVSSLAGIIVLGTEQTAKAKQKLGLLK